MYNHKLDTFSTVVDCGSFSKASEILFISTTAVMKQMNSLEEELGLTLLTRTQSGIEVTEAGKLIYKDAQFLRDYSSKSIREARALTQKYDTTFCVGTSLLNPAKPFMDLWYTINKDFTDYKLHLVSFDDDREDILSVIGQLGEKFDFLIGVCDSQSWLSLCNFLPMGKYKKMIAVAKDHPLASKSLVTLDDLKGETLIMVKSGDSGTNDYIRNELERNYPEITIEDTGFFYDLSVFNECAESQKILLTIECWENVHPGLVTIPVDWQYTIPYGLLYCLSPPDDVLKLVNLVLKSNEQ